MPFCCFSRVIAASLAAEPLRKTPQISILQLCCVFLWHLARPLETCCIAAAADNSPPSGQSFSGHCNQYCTSNFTLPMKRSLNCNSMLHPMLRHAHVQAQRLLFVSQDCTAFVLHVVTVARGNQTLEGYKDMSRTALSGHVHCRFAIILSACRICTIIM